MKRSRFTVIELLVVIGIIGVLAALLLPALASAQDKAKENNALMTANSIATAIKMFETTYLYLPYAQNISTTFYDGGGKANPSTPSATSPSYDGLMFALSGVYGTKSGSTVTVKNDSTLWAKLNPKSVSFLSMDKDFYKNAFLGNPWGQRFYVVMSTSENGNFSVSMPKNGSKTGGSHTETVMGNVGVISEVRPETTDYENGTRVITSWRGIIKYTN